MWIKSAGRRVGLLFDCPHCSCRLAIGFSNPVDGGPAEVEMPMGLGQNDGRRWHREGESFDQLTLKPSIDAPGHWHGWLTGGELKGA